MYSLLLLFLQFFLLVYTRVLDSTTSVGIVISLIPFMLTLVSSFGQTSNNVDGVYYSLQEYRDVSAFLKQNDAKRQTSQFLYLNPLQSKSII